MALVAIKRFHDYTAHRHVNIQPEVGSKTVAEVGQAYQPEPTALLKGASCRPGQLSIAEVLSSRKRCAILTSPIRSTNQLFVYRAFMCFESLAPGSTTRLNGWVEIAGLALDPLRPLSVKDYL